MVVEVPAHAYMAQKQEYKYYNYFSMQWFSDVLEVTGYNGVT